MSDNVFANMLAAFEANPELVSQLQGATWDEKTSIMHAAGVQVPTEAEQQEYLAQNPDALAQFGAPPEQGPICTIFQ